MPDETKLNGTPPESPQPAEKPTADAKVPPASPATQSAEKPAAPRSSAPTIAPAAGAPAAAPPRPGPPKPAGPVPTPWESELAVGLKKVYGSGIREASTYLGQNYLVVDPSILNEILMLMRDDEGFDYCVDLTAVHYPKREKAEFDVIYVLYSFAQNTRVRVKTQIAAGATVPSAVAIWPAANWL